MAENGKSPEDGGTDPQSGVLGNLPRTRPSVRSPRRPDAPPEPPPQADPGPEARAAEPESSSQAELEALARSGLALAGGAASLGLRIAGRAAAAVRDAVERR